MIYKIYKAKVVKVLVVVILSLFASLLQAKDVDITISYFETHQNLSIKDIKSKDFIPLNSKSFNKGLGKKKYWLKVEIKNNTSSAKESILELQNPSIDHIKLYGEKVFVTGDHEKFGTRDIDAINFAFSVKLKPYQKKLLYIMIESNNAVTIPIKLFSKDNFLKKEMILNRGLFLFLGFMLALLVYNSYMYLLLREKPYLFYVLFEFVYVTLLVSMSGLGNSFLWKDIVFINEFTQKYFDDLSIILFILFVLSFLEIKKYFPYIYNISKVVILLNTIVMITSGTIHNILLKPVMIGSIWYIVFIIYLSVQKKLPYAKYILTGAILLSIGSLSTLIKNFGWIEINYFNTWAIYICAVLEGMLFSFVIVKRIERLKEHDRKLQLYQKKMLEEEVKKQTNNLNLLLQELNHRVKNNLQVVSSFISLALIKSKDKKVLESLDRQIHTISLLHKTLYKNDNYKQINIKKYFSELIKEIFAIYKPDIKLEMDIKDVNFDFDKTMTLGLILNEILTNILLHSKADIVKIKLFFEDEIFTLEVEDNGVGFDFKKTSKTLGLKLIKRLVTRKLNGDLDIKSDKTGSRFVIKFR